MYDIDKTTDDLDSLDSIQYTKSMDEMKMEALNKMIKEGSDNLVAGDWDTIADAIADKL